MKLEDLDRLPKGTLLALLKAAIAEKGINKSVDPLVQPNNSAPIAFADHQVIQMIEDHNLKLARELHDDLCPHLTCIEMALQSIQNQPGLSESDRVGKMDGLLKVVKTALLKTRTMTTGLNLLNVEELGLSKALSNWVSLMDSVLQMKLVFVGAATGFTLRESTANVHVFRIAQESIQNAIKHSDATLIEVRVEMEGENLVLTVQDNGKGKVEGGHMANAGFGISSMRFRSQLLHAQLSFCENDPQGVKVKCEIPSVISPD